VGRSGEKESIDNEGVTLRLIRKQLKLWLIGSLIKGKVVTQIARLVKLPVTAVKYFPYRYGEDSYYISKLPNTEIERCSYGLPVPPKELWQGYGKTPDEYLASGREHVQKMFEILGASNFSLGGDKRILELGCGCGRMIRHLKDFADSGEVWGTDVYAEYIIWCKQYLSPPFNFATTTIIPHLPFEDGYFDFIYAGSVFTHIDDLQDAWLLEIRRVLAPSGMFYITIHDEHTIELLDTVFKNSWFEKYLNADPAYYTQKKKAGMIVVGRSTDSQVFYDLDYFRRNLRSVFKVVSVTREAYGFQTGILLKK
jgi:ubiquinone/menaquinone biosynthesis C-methylase UbiE